jgi:hypothetical protein
VERDRTSKMVCSRTPKIDWAARALTGSTCWAKAKGHKVVSSHIHPTRSYLPERSAATSGLGVCLLRIASRIGVSRWYAGRIRQGYVPHPRHWVALAEQVGISAEE